MGFLDIFKGKQYKTELEKLQQEHEALKALMTPEMHEALEIKKEIERLQEEKNSVQKSIDALNQTIKNKNNDISSLNNQISFLEETIKSKKHEIVSLDEEILVQEFGLYSPKFDFSNALGYKEKLSENRSKTKSSYKRQNSRYRKYGLDCKRKCHQRKENGNRYPETPIACI